MQSAQTELDFINSFLSEISPKSVRYGEDYLSRTLPPTRIKVIIYKMRNFFFKKKSFIKKSILLYSIESSQMCCS